MPKRRKPTKPIYSIAQQLSSARKVKDLTQKELSEKTGIAESRISDYETARAAPSFATIQKLAGILGSLFIDATHVWIDTNNSVQENAKKQSEEIKALRSEVARLKHLVGEVEQ